MHGRVKPGRVALAARRPSPGRGRSSPPPGVVPWLSALLLGAACGAACGDAEPGRSPAFAGDPRLRGTFVATRWAEMGLATDRRGSGLGSAVLEGEVAILEGDGELVSGIGGALGVRFDEERNDLGRVTARYAERIADVPGVLVLFTTFDDLGAAGPAYFVPIASETEGTGLGPIDQRVDFGAGALEGVVNLKRLDAHAPDTLAPLFVHELAHRHLAYLSARTEGSTVALPLTGRQGAHWHAALHSEGSLLGGHGWRETTTGRFVVTEKNLRLSELDLYGLGLLPAGEVGPFFFIRGARTEGGALLPAGAELFPGSRALGERLELGAGDVVRALGPRSPEATEQRIVLAVLTAPGEAATASASLALAARVDALRPVLEAAWVDQTRGLGSLCTRIAGCLDAERPAPPADPGCTCAEARSERRGGAGAGAEPGEAALALGLVAVLGACAWGRSRPIRRARPWRCPSGAASSSRP